MTMTPVLYTVSVFSTLLGIMSLSSVTYGESTSLEEVTSLRSKIHLMEAIFRNDIGYIREEFSREKMLQEQFRQMIERRLSRLEADSVRSTVTASTASMYPTTSPRTGLQLDTFRHDLMTLKQIYKSLQKDLEEIKRNATEALRQPCLRSCSEGWTRFGDKCYLINLSTRVWLDARYSCLSAGGGLARIKDLMTQLFIERQLAKFPSIRHLLIDGTDQNSEGHWVYAADNQPLEFTHWINNQPDNYYGREHCASINVNAGYKWNDLPCDSPYNFACEKAPSC